MPERPRDFDRPEGAEAADAFARRLAEESGDLGDLVKWDDDRDAESRGRDDEPDFMPPSRPILSVDGGGSSFNAFPSTAPGSLHGVMVVVLPIGPAAGRPVEALRRRGEYYGLALSATRRWLGLHEREETKGSLELHLVTEAWPLCLLQPMVGAQGLLPSGAFNEPDPFVLWHMIRRNGYPPSSDPHAAFSSLTRSFRNFNLWVRPKLVDRRRIIELAPFRKNAWPRGW